MIRTVEVINLLNMIRNDEETPNLIIWKGKAYKRQWGDYMGDEPIDEYYVNEDGDSWFTDLDLALDSEIQIVYLKYTDIDTKDYKPIEEIITDKKIYDELDEDKDDEYFIYDESDEIYIGEKYDSKTKCILYLIRKINEIIKIVNCLNGYNK